MTPAPIRRLRAQLQRFHHVVRGRHWFPHVPLALLLGLAGLSLLRAELGTHWDDYAQLLVLNASHLQPKMLPSLLIGGGMLTMALGLLWRSRLAWTMALLLEIVGTFSLVIGQHSHHDHVLLAYFVFVLVALLFSWRQFDRTSVAASTLFALTSVAMLLMYATFGAYYLGMDFKPQITDLVTALYFSMVTMSTVGYGDITPQTSEAKLFTVSVIVLGVAVFATSLTAVIAPMVSRSLQRIVNRKGSRMKRENHFVVIGNTSLAINTWHELARRGRPVTRLLREAPEEGELKDTDYVVGDPSSTEILREAGAHRAEAVLAMLADDSENAFVVLAVKELEGHARTVAAVNDARHLSRVKLVQPDVVIAPQVLGGELLAMLLSGEQVTPDFVMQRVFQQVSEPAKPS
ncbi:MAG: voltage-gated potassium channel protein [Rhodanobacter sp.]|uniref:Voltage-gated potassium channel protein n=1 Tax=Rhodanobacter glycinis TaxID=582702 RepID=A0A5B9E374_9GAMM|nr:voltage-gated potassium channel protein [Rhodanobacter glycinis]QEE25121.1 voltage-gated potassium channel protein [Rhodanobacter glycinis]TAM27792.1 MAG: voltage-gated potassium channel protein [Rhodanobacter sp.]